jgi:hypothetical protein
VIEGDIKWQNRKKDLRLRRKEYSAGSTEK